MSTHRQLHHIPEARDLSWKAKANCLGVDPDLFFIERGASTRQAREVCAGCVVRDECLAYALDENIVFGVWGGKSVRQRKAMRRQQRGAA